MSGVDAVTTPATCEEWTGARSDQGYGTTTVQGKTVYAHRAAWFAAGREIPSGLQIDHLCRNRACINVSHMEVVTSRENTLRGFGPTAINARRQTCPRGHALDGVKGRRRMRYCKTCHRAKQWVRDEAAREQARDFDAASQQEEDITDKIEGEIGGWMLRDEP